MVVSTIDPPRHSVNQYIMNADLPSADNPKAVKNFIWPSIHFSPSLSTELSLPKIVNLRVYSSDAKEQHSDNRKFRPLSSAPSDSYEPESDNGTPSNIDLDELFEWEHRKQGTGFWLHAASGSCAGVVEHLIMYPIDTIKTRLQALTPSIESTARSSVRRVCQEVYAESGYHGVFRGFAALGSGCIPAHAALFTVYELAKQNISTSNPISASLCGSLATISHDFILTPFDVVKQRLQLGCYTGLLDCVRTIVRTEGFKAFYRSMPTTVFMNVPYGAILVTVNEGLKRHFETNRRFQEQELQYTDSLQSSSALTHFPFLASYFFCAGTAGGVAGALTTPLDVIKTRLQTQDIKLKSPKYESCTQPNRPLKRLGIQYIKQSRVQMSYETKHLPRAPLYTNFWPTVRLIYYEEGVRGLWRGAATRLALSVPSAAICWGTYESVKCIFSRYL